MVDGAAVDYSQPLALASSPVDDPTAGADKTGAYGQMTREDQAMGLLDAARADFAQGDYASTLADCNKAVARAPDSAVAHEFRALALFALQRYQEAAGTIYAVLSAGPGWDWPTLAGLYPNVDVYTGQLRALERFVESNPSSAEARFLLAYHYMTCAYTDAAAKQLKVVVQRNPKDQLSAQLLSAMTTTAAQPTSPSVAQAVPSTPVDAAMLAGEWKAVRADGTSVALSLAKDAKYTWKFARNDGAREFSGTYSVADNLLILKEGGSPVMVGQVRLLADNRFNFKLPGENPNDPGLTFAK
jgi:tetratricopeptide (TPR) repeat protein